MTIPALGYPSKSSAAMALRREGLTYAEIARRLNTKTNCIGELLRCASQRGEGDPVKRRIQVDVHAATHLAIERAACRRGVSVARFAALIIEHAARDGLINAIMDDGGPDAAR